MVQNLRGFPDIIQKGPEFNEVIWTCTKQAESLGYKAAFTPILESALLFNSLGNDSDVVKKEMFCFKYKEQEVALRPEVTASLVKSIINNGISKGRFFYCGPNFRKERPQKGRYRQFYQFGCENVGFKSPFREIECFIIINNILKHLKIDFTILINHIGQENTRQEYVGILKKYFESCKDLLSPDSQNRLIENRVLRILDSKTDNEIVKNAPSILDFLEKEEIEHLNEICQFLESEGISYQISNKLVRGLDYYNSIVFEVIAHCQGASQNSIAGGGAYDNLFQQMGSQSKKAFGFAMGLDRIMLCDPVVVKYPSATLCFITKHYGVIGRVKQFINIDGVFSNIRDALAYATSNNVNYLVIIDHDYPNLLIKNLKTKKQESVNCSKIKEFLQNI